MFNLTSWHPGIIANVCICFALIISNNIKITFIYIDIYNRNFFLKWKQLFDAGITSNYYRTTIYSNTIDTLDVLKFTLYN